ncbi:DUF2624 domain-containing protein [Virgibacillus oceani]|uniref:tRNA methyltransferase n=1 Tax=Virgibacillus oceani TaxID=1479511 RepID=A0A917H157_9BACI|nr:DUF2624 domain-containing protein [Virgibacillus oceani]GGG63525.1 hypothetical protein GCM10011398_03700 [Virgibacillus oceani]
MSTFIKEMIAKKLKQLTSDELLHYSKKYGFNLSQAEAQSITKYLKTQQIDPFSSQDRVKMLKELARITDLQTAKKAQKLFEEIIKSYGLEYLFN